MLMSFDWHAPECKTSLLQKLRGACIHLDAHMSSVSLWCKMPSLQYYSSRMYAHIRAQLQTVTTASFETAVISQDMIKSVKKGKLEQDKGNVYVKTAI